MAESDPGKERTVNPPLHKREDITGKIHSRLVNKPTVGRNGRKENPQLLTKREFHSEQQVCKQPPRDVKNPALEAWRVFSHDVQAVTAGVTLGPSEVGTWNGKRKPGTPHPHGSDKRAGFRLCFGKNESWEKQSCRRKVGWGFITAVMYGNPQASKWVRKPVPTGESHRCQTESNAGLQCPGLFAQGRNQNRTP